ncbi:MAG: DNA-processing protein DprA [Rhodoferax sp.]
METQELQAWLRLRLSPGVGPVGAQALLKAFGLPQALWDQPMAAWRGVVGERSAQGLATPPEALPEVLERTLRWLDEGQGAHRVLSLGDPHYPSALLALPDPPLLLYAIAKPGLWQAHSGWPVQRALAVVGSRNPTPQGAENARRFAQALAEQGLCIVSGLALGIDGAAHEGALSAARSPAVATVAVVGTGLDRVYPARHRALAHRIAEHGIVLSEYDLGTPPLAPHFPQRNRIIAALGAGTLVVEAALQSGSLITARLSADLGREVFAIPGSIHAPQSKGCHALIRQGAKLVECAQDILEELPGAALAPALGLAPPTAHPASPDQPGSPPETGPQAPEQGACPVYNALGFEPSGLDHLLQRTGWGVAALQARLLELELAGRVQRLPGGTFQRRVVA